MRRRGIALVMIAGLLALLAGTAAALARIVIPLRSQTTLQADTAAARLLARSGIEYAAARLYEDPSPWTPPVRENQSDDRAFRDDESVPLENARNFSYAFTEPYTDLNGNGRYDPTLDPFADWNGNNRFDSWSGRLRGRYGMTGGTFVLKIESEDGRINVNQGMTTPTDWDKNGVPDYRDEGKLPPQYVDGNSSASLAYKSPAWAQWSDALGANGVAVRNRRVADLLSSLGEIAGASQPEVGRLLLASRPSGGYAARGELQRTLGADWMRMRSLLTLHSSRKQVYAAPDIGQSTWFYSGVGRDPNLKAEAVPGYTRFREFLETRPPIGFRSAHPYVLQALLQWLASPYFMSWVTHLPIQPDLAKSLAKEAVRRRPFRTWQEFSRWLWQAGDNAYRGHDLQGWAAGLWKNVMYGVVEANLNPDGLRFRGHDYIPAPFHSWSWLTYDGEVAYDGRGELPVRIGKSGVDRVPYPPGAPQEDPLLPYIPFVPSTWPQYRRGGFGTQEVTLGPEDGLFEVESLGRVSGSRAAPRSWVRVSGELCVRGFLSATSPGDFENLEAKAGVLPPGVVAVGNPEKDRMQVHPVFPIDSIPESAGTDREVCIMQAGWLQLMDRSDGLKGGEAFYQPCWEEGQPMRVPRRAGSFAESFADVSTEQWGECVIGNAPPFWEIPDGPQAPAAGSGRFSWPRQGRPFPWDQGGTVQAGTVEFWVGKTWRLDQNKNPAPLLAGIYRDQTGSFVMWAQDGDSLSGIQRVHLELNLAGFSFSTQRGNRGSVQGYVRGIPDPGLFGSYMAVAIDSTTPLNMEMDSLDEMRLYREPRDAFYFLARGTEPRYWLPDSEDPPGIADPGLKTRLGTIPSFLSPAYRFSKPVTISGAQWDGYVPKLIRDAASGTAPVRVQLLCELAGARSRTVTLPEGLWREGGGWTGLEIPGVIACRFRVQMDARGPTGHHNETPVLDSICISYKKCRFVAAVEE